MNLRNLACVKICVLTNKKVEKYHDFSTKYLKVELIGLFCTKIK